MANKIETIIMPSEITDEMAEVISERLRVCGGIADDIWEELKAAAPVVERQDAIGTLKRVGQVIVFDAIGDPHIRDGMEVFTSPPAPATPYTLTAEQFEAIEVLLKENPASQNVALQDLLARVGRWDAPVAALPDNLLSHRNTWLQAMERLVELEPESGAPDEDEKGFWRHELKAMRDMYADLDRLATK